MTHIPNDDSKQIRIDLLRTDEELATKQRRVQSQAVQAWERGDMESYTRLAQRDGEIIAARLLKDIYGTFGNICDDYKNRHL